MDQVYVLLQESPSEVPSAAMIMVPTGGPQEAVLARIPLVCEEFFGKVPDRLVTWRVERHNGRWMFFRCKWREQQGEEGNVGGRDIPDSVLVLLMRYVGKLDGIEAALSTVRLLIDIAGASEQYKREFPHGIGIQANDRLAQTSYTSGWIAGVEDGLAYRYKKNLMQKSGADA